MIISSWVLLPHKPPGRCLSLVFLPRTLSKPAMPQIAKRSQVQGSSACPVWPGYSASASSHCLTIPKRKTWYTQFFPLSSHQPPVCQKASLGYSCAFISTWLLRHPSTLRRILAKACQSFMECSSLSASCFPQLTQSPWQTHYSASP